jgi:hypothetical protein
MNNLNLTDEILEKEISQAREAAKLADSQEPRAQSVHYDAQEKQIVLKLKNGTTFLFPPNLIQGLMSASDKDIAEVEITPSCEGLHWETLDVDLSIPSLLMGIFGTKLWMAKLGSKGGSVTSESKATAARNNGKKGGRPKKNYV